jgi:hypothetical protein
VNAALSALTQRGLIRVDGRRIIVTDMAGLRARAGLPAPPPGSPLGAGTVPSIVGRSPSGRSTSIR